MKKRAPNRGSFKPGNRVRSQRQDGVINPYSGHGTSRDRRQYTTFGLHFVSDDEALILRRTNWIARKIIEWLPEEAYRRGYDVQMDDKSQAEELVAQAEDLGANEALVQAAQLERANGGAAVFAVIDDGSRDPGEPLDFTRIRCVEALHVLEARELWPVSWYTDLRSPKFGTPETYQLQPIGARSYMAGMPRVHESRMAIFPGKRVSKQTLPGQREGWGDSCLMPVREQLADFGLGWGSAAQLIASFARAVVKKKGLMDLLASKEGREVLEIWKDGLDMETSTLKGILIGEEDEVTRESTPLSGLDAVLLQLAQVMAGAAEMSMTRLFGMSPAGLNATGEGDARNDYATIESAQSTRYRRPTEWVIKLLMCAQDGPCAGVEPEVWSLQWRPLWTPSEKEQAETRLTQAQVDAIELDRGVVTAQEVAESRHGGDQWSADTKISMESRTAAMMLPRVVAAPEPALAPGTDEPA